MADEVCCLLCLKLSSCTSLSTISCQMVTEDPLADETGLGVDEGEEVKVPHYTLIL